MRRGREFVLFVLLVALLAIGFLLYRDRLDDLELPRRDPIEIRLPDVG